MTLRQVPGTLALGLLASLIGHAALYGGGHAMGGAYHELLVQLATAGSLGLLVLLAALAWTGSRSAADGSILGARLAARLPGLPPLAASAVTWFALGEHVESHHAGGGPVLTVMLLVAAAWSLLALSRAAVRLLAGAVIAISRQPFAARTPIWLRQTLPVPIARRSPVRRRRFARPPPIANVRA